MAIKPADSCRAECDDSVRMVRLTNSYYYGLIQFEANDSQNAKCAAALSDHPDARASD